MLAAEIDRTVLHGSALSDVVLGYAPVIDRWRTTAGMRLRVGAVTPQRWPRLDQLYRELADAMPTGAPPVMLSLNRDDVPRDILRAQPSASLWLEVPAGFAVTADGGQLVSELMQAGFRLVLRGVPATALPPELLPAFTMSLIPLAEDRRKDAPPRQPDQGMRPRRIPFAQSGVRRLKDLEHSFARGAIACVGWPWDDALERAAALAAPPDYSVISEMLVRLNRGDDVASIETIVRHDAALTYRLLRMVNSSGNGLRVAVSSLRHAVMMLGYEKLSRWLRLQLATASRDANLRPVMIASYKRGVFIEHLTGVEDDDQLREEVFILGAFSLLDRLLATPFEKVFETLHVPANVYDALVKKSGPYAPYLRIAEAVERDDGEGTELLDCLEQALVSVNRCNEAVLRTFVQPDYLHGDSQNGQSGDGQSGDGLSACSRSGPEQELELRELESDI